mgnify:CR=1 FL=1
MPVLRNLLAARVSEYWGGYGREELREVRSGFAAYNNYINMSASLAPECNEVKEYVTFCFEAYFTY